MKKFSFSLQKLLDYKEQLFDVERTILADMQAALSAMIRERDEMQHQHDTRSGEFRTLAAQGISAMDMETHKNYLTMLDFSIRQKDGQITLQRRAVDRQADKVREAKIEISIIEKLKEKKLEEYNYLDAKDQEQFIEEYVSSAKAMADYS